MSESRNRKGWLPVGYALVASGFAMDLVAVLLLTLKKGPPVVGWVLLAVGLSDLVIGVIFVAKANRT